MANTLDGAAIQANKEVRMMWSYVMQTIYSLSLYIYIYIYIYDVLTVWLFVYDLTTTLYCACITSFAHLLPYTTLLYIIQPQAIISAVSPYSLLQANEAWRQQFLGSVAAEQVCRYVGGICLYLCVLVIFVCEYIFIFLLISVP